MGTSIFRVLQRLWIPLVIVLVVGLGGFTVWRIHGIFGSYKRPSYSDSQTDNSKPFNPKRLTYEVFGSPGTGGKLVYVDIEGHPHPVDITTLPWSHTETTTLTVASGSISVHVHGGQVGCRMLVDGVVRDEQSGNHEDADVECRVKSA